MLHRLNSDERGSAWVEPAFGVLFVLGVALVAVSAVGDAAHRRIGDRQVGIAPACSAFDVDRWRHGASDLLAERTPPGGALANAPSNSFERPDGGGGWQRLGDAAKRIGWFFSGAVPLFVPVALAHAYFTGEVEEYKAFQLAMLRGFVGAGSDTVRSLAALGQLGVSGAAQEIAALQSQVWTATWTRG